MKNQIKIYIFIIVLTLNTIIFAKISLAQDNTVGNPPIPFDNCGNKVMDPGEQCDYTTPREKWNCPIYPDREPRTCYDKTANRELWCTCDYIFKENNLCGNGRIDPPYEECDPKANSDDNSKACKKIYSGGVFINCVDENDKVNRCTCFFSGQSPPIPPNGPGNGPNNPPPICPLDRLDDKSTYSVGTSFSGSIEAKAAINPTKLTDKEIQKMVGAVNQIKDDEPFIERIKKLPGRGLGPGIISLIIPKTGEDYDAANKKIADSLKGRNFVNSKVPTIDPSPIVLDLEKTLLNGDLDITFKSSRSQTRNADFGCYLPQSLKLRLDYNSYSKKNEISPLIPASVRSWLLSDIKDNILNGINSINYGIIPNTDIGKELDKLIQQALNLNRGIYRINSQLIKGDIIIDIKKAEELDENLLLKIAAEPKTGTNLDKQTIEKIRKDLKDKYVLKIHEDLTASFNIGGKISESPIWDIVLKNVPSDSYYIITQKDFGGIIKNILVWLNNIKEKTDKNLEYVVVTVDKENVKREINGIANVIININKPNTDLIRDLINSCCGNQPITIKTEKEFALFPQLVLDLEQFIDPFIELGGILAISGNEQDRKIAPEVICEFTPFCDVTIRPSTRPASRPSTRESLVDGYFCDGLTLEELKINNNRFFESTQKVSIKMRKDGQVITILELEDKCTGIALDLEPYCIAHDRTITEKEYTEDNGIKKLMDYEKQDCSKLNIRAICNTEGRACTILN